MANKIHLSKKWKENLNIKKCKECKTWFSSFGRDENCILCKQEEIREIRRENFKNEK